MGCIIHLHTVTKLKWFNMYIVVYIVLYVLLVSCIVMLQPVLVVIGFINGVILKLLEIITSSSMLMELDTDKQFPSYYIFDRVS